MLRSSSAAIPIQPAASSSPAALSSSGDSSDSSSGGKTYPQLVASIRNAALIGSQKVRRLRNTGQVPGVLYGVDEDQNVVKILVTVDEKAVSKEMRERGKSLESTIYELTLQSDGESGVTQKHLVTPRQLQVNPLTEKPISVNFLKYWPDTRMRIPIEFINADQCVDLRRGSFLVRVNRFVECVCHMEIPKSLVVDLAGVQKGDVLRLNCITFPPNVKPSRNVPPDFVLGVVRTAKG